jgi:hypothetical protein
VGQTRHLDVQVVAFSLPQHDGLRVFLVDFRQGDSRCVEPGAQTRHRGADPFLRIGELRQLRRQAEEEGGALVRLLHLVDVGGGAEPARDGTLLVEHRKGADQVPAHRRVETAQARFDVEGLAAAESVLPSSEHTVAVRGVHERAGFDLPGQGSEGQAEEVQPQGIHVVEGTIGTAQPHGMGQRLGQNAEMRGAVSASLHRTPPGTNRGALLCLRFPWRNLLVIISGTPRFPGNANTKQFPFPAMSLFGSNCDARGLCSRA